jgi:hypothetical protein
LREGPMSAPLALLLGITLMALLTFTKGVPRHQNDATATTAPAIFQQMMPVAY